MAIFRKFSKLEQIHYVKQKRQKVRERLRKIQFTESINFTV
jgi:hypothetical protein